MRVMTCKVELSAQLLAEEKFTFQKATAKAIQDNDIPLDLVINLDQTPLCYISPGTYTFHFKGRKRVPFILSYLLTLYLPLTKKNEQ